MTRPRVVIDCNVFLQAFLNESGPAGIVLRLMEKSVYDLLLSRAVIRELRAVLSYPSVRQRNPDITTADVDEFLHRLAYRGTILRRVRHVFDYPRARQDEPYVDLAIAGKADYLVSRDQDLLTLMKGHSSDCKQFRRISHPLRVVDPVEFLRLLDESLHW